MTTERQSLTDALSDPVIRAYVVADLNLDMAYGCPDADVNALVEQLARRRMVRQATASANQADGIRKAVLMVMSTPYSPTSESATTAQRLSHSLRGGRIRQGPTPYRQAILDEAAKWGFCDEAS